MNVSYTISGGGTSIDITSASVTLPDAATSTPPEARSLQASVSCSQSLVVSRNIGTRISSASAAGRGSPGGVGRDSPGGQGRDAPGGEGRDEPGSGANFASGPGNTFWSPFGDRHKSEGASLRQLALRASFDSSEMALAAAGLAAAEEERGLPGSVRPRVELLADRPLTVWGHGSFTLVDNDRNDGDDDSRFDGDVWGYNVGVDYRFRPGLYAGLSLGYAQTALTTTYNSGSYDEQNWSLTPYAVYQPLDGLTLSAMAGYSMGDIDRTRDNHAVTSSTDSEMWFGAVNARYTMQPAEALPLDLSANIGLSVSHKDVEAYTESDDTAVAKATSNTRQLKMGLEAAYSFYVQGATLQPYVKGSQVHDFMDPTNDDQDAFDLGGGLRIGSEETGWSGTLEGSTQLGREDYAEHSVSGIVAYGFAIGSEGNPGSGMAEPYVKSSFAGGSRQFGTGLSYSHGRLPFTATLDVLQVLPTGGGPGVLEARLGAKMTY